MTNNKLVKISDNIFQGSLYFFYSFDIGDDIDIKSLHKNNNFFAHNGTLKSNFFKTYNKPQLVDPKSLELSKHCIMGSLYNFGAISLRYSYPFSAALDELKSIINDKYDMAEKYSKLDAKIIFNAIKDNVRESRFFNLHRSYALIQVNTKTNISPYDFKNKYAHEIASMLRFEIEN